MDGKPVFFLVLETLLSPKTVHRHPLLMMFHAIVISSAGIWIAHISFPNSAGLLSIAFMAIGLIPIIETLLRFEEKTEARHPGFAATFIARHFNIIQAYAWLFVGLIISYAFWYTVLPMEMKANVFSLQESALEEIGQLKQTLAGMFSVSQSSCGKDIACWSSAIFFNNASVLLLLLLLSLVFGAGAIFLLGWNASVIGVVIGKDVLALASNYQQFGFLQGILAFLHGLVNGLGLVPHGLFEAIGYFIGAIAGAIIGIAATKRHYFKHELSTIIKDTAILVVIAIASIAIGAVIEAEIIVLSL